MLRLFLKSFHHAFSGLQYAYRHERNFRIECFFALVVIIALFSFPMDVWKQVILIIMIGWVLSAELANTIVERIVDMVKPKLHPYVRVIKDLMAATVLLSSVFALIVGILIILPYIIP
ncbi:MAG: diacylglycerol kinase [Candidatus Moraniibacteriota bacterium]|nr:MAG: diacylglycerol kinase [Candidatus Moranbacteria bacterium]